MSTRDHRGWAFDLSIAIVKPALLALTKRDWVDTHKIPRRGGCVVVANHTSHLDPFTLSHLLYDGGGRLPHFLAKDGLFRIKGVGAILRNARQIPVARTTSEAGSAFAAAVEGVQKGYAVVFYPEGTITRDPGLWPMRGKTGAARVALESGAPVIPIAQWGAHQILYPYAKRPHLLPRKTIHAKVGDPVDLSEFEGKPITGELLHLATDRIMDAITALEEDIRGERAPAVRFDPRKEGVSEIGNPHLPDEHHDDHSGGHRAGEV